MAAPVESRLNRPGVLNVIGIATLVLVLAVLVIAAITLPASLTSRNNTETGKRTDDLASCRSTARAPIDDANLEIARARTDLDLLTNAGLQAAVLSDKDELERIVQQGPAARRAIDVATTRLAQATADYQAAVKLSRTDPDLFLRRCRQPGG